MYAEILRGKYIKNTMDRWLDRGIGGTYSKMYVQPLVQTQW
jgi:hypothetical protein